MKSLCLSITKFIPEKSLPLYGQRGTRREMEVEKNEDHRA